MKAIEKREYIYSHLHEVNEPAIDELYSKMVSILNESLIIESEDDVEQGKLTSHGEFKKEVQSWRPTK
jgi:hypothetical protein